LYIIFDDIHLKNGLHKRYFETRLLPNNINIDYQNINNLNPIREPSEETERISNSFFQLFKKQWSKKYIPIDIKYIDEEEEYVQCMVSYNYIKPNDEYIKCDTCDKIFSVCVKTEWIDKKGDCPHCRTSWNNFTIYINSKNNLQPKNKEKSFLYWIGVIFGIV
jgi:hypothetical protein